MSCGPFMEWLPLVGSLELHVSFAQEPYKRDDILKKRPVILRSLLTVAMPYAIHSLYLAHARTVCADFENNIYMYASIRIGVCTRAFI